MAELVSGARRTKDREAIAGLAGDLPVHETPLAHWIRVGELRRSLREKGLQVSTPDAHVAQRALDLDAVLRSSDQVFVRIARLSSLRVNARWQA